MKRELPVCLLPALFQVLLRLVRVGTGCPLSDCPLGLGVLNKMETINDWVGKQSKDLPPQLWSCEYLRRHCWSRGPWFVHLFQPWSRKLVRGPFFLWNLGDLLVCRFDDALTRSHSIQMLSFHSSFKPFALAYPSPVLSHSLLCHLGRGVSRINQRQNALSLIITVGSFVDHIGIKRRELPALSFEQTLGIVACSKRD